MVVLAQPGAEAEARVKAFAAQMTSAERSRRSATSFSREAPFSTENGMLRPNLKVDRRGIAAKYKLNQ